MPQDAPYSVLAYIYPIQDRQQVSERFHESVTSPALVCSLDFADMEALNRIDTKLFNSTLEQVNSASNIASGKQIRFMANMMTKVEARYFDPGHLQISDIIKRVAKNVRFCYNYRHKPLPGGTLMAQLEAFQLPGYELEMYPEDHSPPHFHIIKDDWNIRIMFNLSIIKREIVWDSKYPENLKEYPLKSGESRILLDLLKTNCRALNRQWKALHPSRQR